MNRQILIQQRLQDAFAPVHLAVVDESHQHAVPPGSQSHFKALIVSERFYNLKTLERHRQVNQLLKDLFDQGLHALALHTWTPKQWLKRGDQIPASPPCEGGSASASIADKSGAIGNR